MRRIVYSGLLLLIAWSGDSLAARKYGRAGCGLGSIVMGPTGNQSSAYTTNSVTYSQIFGITSGTSNCTPDNEAQALNEQEKFIQANLVSLSKEMAQGSGETLKAYASVLGCPSGVFSDFAGQMQKSYHDIFAAPGSLAVLDATKDEAKANPVLAEQCTLLI